MICHAISSPGQGIWCLLSSAQPSKLTNSEPQASVWSQSLKDAEHQTLLGIWPYAMASALHCGFKQLPTTRTLTPERHQCQQTCPCCSKWLLHNQPRSHASLHVALINARLGVILASHGSLVPPFLLQVHSPANILPACTN